MTVQQTQKTILKGEIIMANKNQIDYKGFFDAFLNAINKYYEEEMREKRNKNKKTMKKSENKKGDISNA